MKHILLALFLLCFTFAGYSQRNPDQLFYAQKAEHYAKLKNTGTQLTVVGGILLVIGVVVLSNSSINQTQVGNGPVQTTTTGNPVTGALAFLGGAAGLGSGIPLWVVGANKEKKYMRKVESLSLKMNITPQTSGVALAFRF